MVDKQDRWGKKGLRKLEGQLMPKESVILVSCGQTLLATPHGLSIFACP